MILLAGKPENINPLVQLLEVGRFSAEIAGTGEEVLDKTSSDTYTLILLDTALPGKDCYEVAELLTADRSLKDIPVIFLSATPGDKNSITKAYISGAIDYISLPADKDILLMKMTIYNKLYEQKRELTEFQRSLSHEVVERKKAEKRLQETVRELRTTLEAIPQIAFTAKPDGRIEYVNHHWYQYSENGEFPDTPPADVPIALHWKEHIISGEPLQMEVRIKKLDEEQYRYHLLHAEPVKEDNMVIKWVGTFTDINQQKLISELLEQMVGERTKELEDMNARLEASNADLQQFASVSSHDLKEPLRKIQMFSAIIRDNAVEGDYKDIPGYAERVMASSRRMTSLINDLLKFSRLSAEPHFETTDLNVLLGEIIADLELSIAEKSAVIDASKLPEIDAMHGQLRQAFQNIISNAIKFSKEGVPPILRIKAERISEKDISSPKSSKGKYYRIIFSDNGIGFDEAYVDKIFTIFQRLNTRDSYEGTGIGLAIAKKIVEKHQGLITARSTPGKGSDFIIVLPIKHDK